MNKTRYQKTRIKPGAGTSHYWRDLWHYRELFLFLSWRDILVRYKQTVIGLAWSVARPLLAMVIFSVIFGGIANLPADGNVPYPILVYAAMLPWQFFATSFQESSNSLVNNAQMISKVYFPRIILPMSSMIVSLVDFSISLVILFGIMVYYNFVPEATILFIPFLLLLAVIPTLGVSLWIASLNVRYRDFKIIVPFVVQFGMYVSPVGFSSSVIPEKWKLLYSLNPMVGVIDGFRWAVLGGVTPIYLPGLLLSIILSAALLISGWWYFMKTEQTFADVI